jgi:hypothetical protein
VPTPLLSVGRQTRNDARVGKLLEESHKPERMSL